MFQDFHVLLIQQQDLIDNIERNVSRARNHVEKAVANVKKANKIQKKSSVVSYVLKRLVVGKLFSSSSDL